MISILIASTAIALIAYQFYVWVTKYYGHFEKQGLKFTKPTFLMGSTGAVFLLNKYTMMEFVEKNYKDFQMKGNFITEKRLFN